VSGDWGLGTVDWGVSDDVSDSVSDSVSVFFPFLFLLQPFFEFVDIHIVDI
jgi:hypothetical protein